MGDFFVYGAGRNKNSTAKNNIARAAITLESETFVYDGNTKTQLVDSVIYNGNTLVENVDYVVRNNEAVNAGAHTLNVFGIGNYGGVATVAWEISKAIGTISVNPNYIPLNTVGDSDTSTVTKTGDGVVSVSSSNTSVATATISGNTITVTAIQDGIADIIATLAEGNNYHGATAILEVSVGAVIPVDISDAVVTLASSSYTYDGTEKTQGVTSVVVAGETLVENTDYTVSGNTATNAGTYTITIQGIGRCYGSTSANWSIAKRKYTKPTITANPTYSAQSQSPTVSGFVSASMTQTGDTQATNAGNYTLTISLKDTANNAWSDNTTAAVNLLWYISKAQGTVSVLPSTITIETIQGTDTATVTKTGDGTVSVSSSDIGVATCSLSGTTITVTAIMNGSAIITVTLADGNNYYGATATLGVTVNAVIPVTGIYGVAWNKSSSTTLTRTDDATLYSNPSPAVSGGNGSSPFDDKFPWSGMRRVTINGNEMVEIPKFWYKWTNENGSLKLQISPTEQTGFYVSPAHANRGDGVGEREVVYVGRYHCNSSYGSTTGATLKTNITRATARTGCTAQGTGFYQLDYAMLWTIRMLYLVEFANWDSQTVIGAGCGNNSSKQTSGASDTMTYHTGTMKSSRNTYGTGVQYRYIEDLWGNVYDWCDGIAIGTDKSAYMGINPASYGDYTSNYRKVTNGISGSGNCIGDWTIPSDSGYEWALFPSLTITDNSYSTYIADKCSATDMCVLVGGSFYTGREDGLFSLYSAGTSYNDNYIGARLQYLPPVPYPGV